MAAMIGYHWTNTIILGKSTWHDLLTGLALPAYALSPTRHIQFIQWKNGKLHPLDHDEAWKISFVARLILLISKNITPFYHLNFWLKFGSLVVIWAGMGGLIKNDKIFITTFATAASLCHLLCSFFFRALHENSMLHDIATCPSSLIENLDDRKKETSTLAKSFSDDHPTLFNRLPEELMMKILRFLADHESLQPFGLTCKWISRFCYQSKLTPLLHLPRIPKSLLKSLKQTLLGQLKFMQCTSRCLRDATDAPVSGTENFPPGKAHLGTYFRIDQIPVWLPAIKSEYPLAPFITVNSDWLGKHHFFYTVTPVNTLALIFTYASNYELSGRSSLYCHKNRHVLILTQVSPFQKNEWWLVFEAWSASTQEYSDAHIRHPNDVTFQRTLLNNRFIRILFDDEGHVTPECQAVWDWFTRFLKEQQVGFFDHQENFFPDSAAPTQKYFMQLKKV
jgi:hypothetical protein